MMEDEASAASISVLFSLVFRHAGLRAGRLPQKSKKSSTEAAASHSILGLPSLCFLFRVQSGPNRGARKGWENVGGDLCTLVAHTDEPTSRPDILGLAWPTAKGASGPTWRFRILLNQFSSSKWL